MRVGGAAGVLPLIEEFVRDYEEHRRAEGVADFDDLMIWARDLVRDRPEVRDYFQRRFKALLIDEFQDTDPIQVELAMLPRERRRRTRRTGASSSPAPGKLFVVGDPKQSIYRFRRADIGIYDEVKAGPLADGLREIVQNFRSVPGVIEWVNDVFDRLFEEREGLQPANVPLARRRLRAGPRPPARRRRPRSRSRGERRRRCASRRPTASPRSSTTPSTGAEPWPVRDRVTRRASRARRWRDVAILLPAPHRPRGLRGGARARSASRTATRAAATTSSARRSATWSSSCSAIDDPRDRVSLIGALRSGAFGCSDDDLVIHAGDRRHAGTTGRDRRERERAGAWRRSSSCASSTTRARSSACPLLVQRVVDREPPGRVRAHRPRRRRRPRRTCSRSSTRPAAFTAAGGGSPRAFTRWLADNTEQRGERGRRRHRRGDRRRRPDHDHARRQGPRVPDRRPRQPRRPGQGQHASPSPTRPTASSTSASATEGRRHFAHPRLRGALGRTRRRPSTSRTSASSTSPPPAPATTS